MDSKIVKLQIVSKEFTVLQHLNSSVRHFFFPFFFFLYSSLGLYKMALTWRLLGFSLKTVRTSKISSASFIIDFILVKLSDFFYSTFSTSNCK